MTVNLGRPKGTAQRGVVSDIAMLRLLSVTNFATIEQLDIELAPGFSVSPTDRGDRGPANRSSWMRWAF